jgi:NACalpha-BTF3-like transcription factor
MMTPFDFLNAINMTKEDLFKDPQAEKDYNAFIVNRGLSYFPDTILLANEMNVRHELPSSLQFSFLLNSATKRKRFSKWHKKDAFTDDLKLIMEYYKYSSEKAKRALDVLTSEQIQIIRDKLYKGGK